MCLVIAITFCCNHSFSDKRSVNSRFNYLQSYFLLSFLTIELLMNVCSFFQAKDSTYMLRAVLIGILLAASASAQTLNCATTQSGYQFNLNPLQQDFDYFVLGGANTNDYYINACKAVTTTSASCNTYQTPVIHMFFSFFCTFSRFCVCAIFSPLFLRACVCSGLRIYVIQQSLARLD